MNLTGRSGDTLTVDRSQEGSVAASWPVGSRVELRITAGVKWPLDTSVSGSLPPANGGTGQASYATGDLLYASSANTLSRLAVGPANHAVVSSGGLPAYAPVVNSIAGTANQVIASAANGNITLSTPQDLATTSTVTFSRATITRAGNSQVTLNTTANGSGDFLVMQQNGLNRWLMGKSGGAESSGNAGSDFFVNRYDDAGAIIDTPINIVRSTGVIALTNISLSTLSVTGSIGTSAQVLHGGATPFWGSVSLTSDVSGVLPVANGGTGQTTAAGAFAAVSPQTTKGDLIGFSTTPVRVPVGANKCVPIADSTQAAGIRWADVAWHESSQPANAYVELVVPTNGTNYVDNAATMENRSQNALGKRGNAAIRFRDALTGYERGAIGYSALSTDNPAYFPNLLYCEIGNLSPDALDTDFAVVNTHPAGAVNLPNTVYFPISVKGSNGQIDMLAGPTGSASMNFGGNIFVSTVGNPRQFMLWGNTTGVRLRERDADDLFAWTTNVDNSVTKDNTSKSSWRQQMGYGTGENRWQLSNMAIGSSSWVDIVKATPTTFDVAVSTIVRGTVSKPGYSRQVPTTGFSITIGANIDGLILEPAGALAGGTVTLPASPNDGQICSVSTTQSITTLTISPNAGQTMANAFSATLSAGGVKEYKFITATSRWYNN